MVLKRGSQGIARLSTIRLGANPPEVRVTKAAWRAEAKSMIVGLAAKLAIAVIGESAPVATVLDLDFPDTWSVF